ncbi:unnamed protein product [Ophioblennius macclurei]
MACSTDIFAVIFLLGFINISEGIKDICDIYTAVGHSLTLPLSSEKLENTHVLKWTHNNTIVFYRQQGRVSVGKPDDISATGSLWLRNVKFSSAGVYQGNLLHPNNTLAKTWTGRLCVMDKVQKPEVRYVCDFKSSAVNLDCVVPKPEGLAFSWMLDKKTLSSETRQLLRISLNQLKGERSFTCSVANKVSRETSDIVHPTCKNPPPPPLLCFTSKTVLGAVAGGAALTLLLITVIIVLCCCNRRNRSQMSVKGKGELRMLSMNRRELDSIGPEYETMHPTERCPPPSPQPSTRACYQNVSQPEAETAHKLPQLPTADEGQEPSPVPKPRTRTAQTPSS